MCANLIALISFLDDIERVTAANYIPTDGMKHANRLISIYLTTTIQMMS